MRGKEEGREGVSLSWQRERGKTDCAREKVYACAYVCNSPSVFVCLCVYAPTCIANAAEMSKSVIRVKFYFILNHLTVFSSVFLYIQCDTIQFRVNPNNKKNNLYPLP